MTPFGPDYAGAYDALYQEKDYAAECDLVERVFNEHASDVRRVLDLGCGTGVHSTMLAERGYDVVGVDRSEDMLRRARQRPTSARFEVGDIADLHLDGTFDAVLIMFAVLGYLTDNASLASALGAARQHLRPGGVLFADAWYGPAVLSQRPSERVKVIDLADRGQIIRAARSALDMRQNLCTVDYELWRLSGDRVCAHTREQHVMRYFFEPELESLLGGAGFQIERIGAFPQLDDAPSEQTWNIAFVARAA